MEEILSNLINELTEEQVSDYTNKIIEYYDINSRHSYSEVSTFIYRIRYDDIDYLLDNLFKIRLNLESNNQDVANKIFKLIDHIQLESRRELHIKDDYFKQMQLMISKKATNDYNKIKKMHQEIEQSMQSQYETEKSNTKKEFERYTKEIEKVNGNIVSVLGIFGAIIVAFFGGLSFLGGVLDNMHNVSAYRLTFTGVIFLVGLFNIIFLLFFCISKLLQQPLWSSCNKCSKCSTGSSPIRIQCIFTKYPLVIIFNIFSLFLLFSIFVLYCLDKYNVCATIIEVLRLNSQNGILIVFFGFILYGIILYITIKIIKVIFYKVIDLNRISSYNEERSV